MNFAAIISLLASPPNEQIEFLAPVPANTESPDFESGNNVYRMQFMYSRFCTAHLGEDGIEGIEHWLRRTNLSVSPTDIHEHPVWIANCYLMTAINMIGELDRGFFYTAHGLKSSAEWELVRHLAQTVLAEAQWPKQMPYASFHDLWESLGGGISLHET